MWRCSADTRVRSFAVRAALWCQPGSRAFGKHIRVPWSHLAPFPRDTEQAGLPIFQHLAVSITVISPQVAFTGQTCLPLCMLPVHVEQHTCFAGLVPWLLHQLSLAADQSRSGAHMHFIHELVTSFELPCCAYTYLSTHVPQLLELWQTDHLHTS